MGTQTNQTKTKYGIHPTHLEMSGLTLQAAESLLDKPDELLTARERYIVTLLSQTPEERQAWKERNFRLLGALFSRHGLGMVGKTEIKGGKLYLSV